MFTQQAPFLLSALSPAVGSTTAQQLTQALGNCNQSLTHRGGVSLQRAGLTTGAGLIQGPGGNPYAYTDGQSGFLAGNDPATQFSPWASLGNNFYGSENFFGGPSFAFRAGDQFWANYPDAAQNSFYDLSQSFNFGPITTNNYSPWYTRLGDVNNFDFSSRLGDIVNNYAGPTFQVAGDSHFDNSVHNTQNVTYQQVTEQIVNESTIENLRVERIFQGRGDPGPAGAVGPAGPPGNAGNPGNPGLGFPQGGYDLPGVRLVSAPAKPQGNIAWPAGGGKIGIPTYRLAGLGAVAVVQDYSLGGSATVDVPEYTLSEGGVTGTVNLPSVKFNADTCTVEYDSTSTVSVEVTLSYSPPALSRSTSSATVDTGSLEIIPGAAGVLDVGVGNFVVEEAGGVKEVALPVPVFEGVFLPQVDLGPGGFNLIPKPQFP